MQQLRDFQLEIYSLQANGRDNSSACDIRIEVIALNKGEINKADNFHYCLILWCVPHIRKKRNNERRVHLTHQKWPPSSLNIRRSKKTKKKTKQNTHTHKKKKKNAMLKTWRGEFEKWQRSMASLTCWLFFFFFFFWPRQKPRGETPITWSLVHVHRTSESPKREKPWRRLKHCWSTLYRQHTYVMLHTRAIERGAAIRIEVTGVSTPASAKKKKTTVFRCWFNFFLIISERKKRDSERGLRITLFCFVSCFFKKEKKNKKKQNKDVGSDFLRLPARAKWIQRDTTHVAILSARGFLPSSAATFVSCPLIIEIILKDISLSSQLQSSNTVRLSNH